MPSSLTRSSIDKVLNKSQLWIILFRFALGWAAFVFALYQPASLTKECASAAEPYDCRECCHRPLVSAEVLGLAGAFTAAAIVGVPLMSLAGRMKPRSVVWSVKCGAVMKYVHGNAHREPPQSDTRRYLPCWPDAGNPLA